MRPTVTPPLTHTRALLACLALLGAGAAQAEDYRPVPGLSAKDRAVLAANMANQGQCRNAMSEVAEAMKELHEDEMLIRIKGICETETGMPGGKDTVMKWLKLAPQSHPERGKMLALLAKTQAAKEIPLEWIPVPAGEFEMGAAETDTMATPDEKPKHKVELDAFLISKYEVTNAQYHSFVKATNHRLPENCCDARYNIWKGDAMMPGVEELPVINVSWDDAVAFCKWIGARLPTEAEWEKAARGTDGRLYPWGNDLPSGNRANYSFDPVSMWEGPASLAKKDQYEFGKSPYGVFEMAGNVWEWVQDWYDENYYKNSPAKNPKGPEKGEARVMRGASWRNTADMLRASNRHKHAPTERRVYIGIRCAKDAK
jgi:formylglycine-generating enzyme required for sulfatase activity